MLLTKGGPQSLVSSPRGGGSTFTTVAPMSPSIIVQKGPERIRERSSTKMLSSGVTARNYGSPASAASLLRSVVDSGRSCDDFATLEMMRGLLDFPECGEGVNEAVDREVRL